MPFSIEDKALIKNCKSERLDTLLNEKRSRNRKHRPKACKRQTETLAYWRERDRCG